MNKKLTRELVALAMAATMATGAGGTIGQVLDTNIVVNAESVGHGSLELDNTLMEIPTLSEVLDQLAAIPEDYTYETKADGSIKIVSYNGTEKKINIPAQIDGKTVTEIGDGAFKGQELELVNLPDSIEYIGNEAFSENSGRNDGKRYQLAILHLPKNLKKIGDSAFRSTCMRTDVSRFEELMSLEEIGEQAFKGMVWWYSGTPDYHDGENYKQEFIFPTSLKKIENEAFAYTMFKKVTFNDGLEYIGRSAFSGDWVHDNTEITVSKSVKYIGGGAFGNFTGAALNHSAIFKYYSGGFVEDYLKDMAEKYNNDDYNYHVNLEEIGTIDEEPSQQEMNYGITVKGAYPEGAVLNAVETTTKWLEDPLFCFDITLQKDGQEVQPDGYITVCIPCSVSGGNLCFINEETGEMEWLNSVYVDGEYRFVTDHLSEYCIKFSEGTDISNALSKPEPKPDNEISNMDTSVDSDTNNSVDTSNTTNTTDNANNTNNTNNTNNNNADNSGKGNSIIVPKTGDSNAMTLFAIFGFLISAVAIFFARRKKSV